MDQIEDKLITQNHSDFSIDHILNRAGTNNNQSTISENNPEFIGSSLDLNFSWLQCSRYCPPKVPRNQRRDGPQKRQLGRHPRIPFTSQQLAILEEKFLKSPYLSSEEVINLSKKLNLADIRVKIWFQNRRARERREKVAPSRSQETQQIAEVNRHLSVVNNSEDVKSCTGSSTSLPSSGNSAIYDFLSSEVLLQNYLGQLPHYVTNQCLPPDPEDSG